MKLLIAPGHYYINDYQGSEYTRAYECIKEISHDKSISGDAIVGFSDVDSLGSIKIHKLYSKKPEFISNIDRIKFPFLVLKKSLFLMRNKQYDCIWHLGPFALNKTFSLLALMNKKKIRFILGPIYTPFDREKYVINERETQKELNVKIKLPIYKKLDSLIFHYFSNVTKVLSDITLKNANKILTVEKYGTELLFKKGFTNTEVIHLGIMKNRFATKPRIKSNNFFNILTVCDLIPRKRVIDIIEAINKITSEYRIVNLKLTIVGDGPIRNALEHTVEEYKLNKYIKFIGRVPRTQVHEYFRNSDLFVFASVLDTMPGVYFEALTASLPMVIAENGSTDELVADEFGGIVVEGKNPAKMAEAIVKIINDSKLYEEMSKKNYLLSNTSYNFEKEIAKLKYILKKNDK